MKVTILTDALQFPSPQHADEEGLLAMGGDLSIPRLLMAYRTGIFPWYDEPPILWWSPDPRFVLYPSRLHVTHSMKQVLRQQRFKITYNQCFTEVISHCRNIRRNGPAGTWINDEIITAYLQLYQSGQAISVEAWQEGILVGGLYGIRLGRVFFGESMFSNISNASKAAFITYVQQIREEGVSLIDCQVYTHHLASLGAEMIPRTHFLQHLQEDIP